MCSDLRNVDECYPPHLGAISLRTSNHFPANSGSKLWNPVIFPPGAGRLLRNDQRSGKLSPCARFPRHLCV